MLGVLVVRWRISDLGTGKAPGAGRVAWVAEGKLWVKDLPDGGARALAAGENISRPAWSPTGNWLFFRRGEDLWLVGVDRSEARRVAQGVGEFAWSPAADVFAYTAGAGLERVVEKMGPLTGEFTFGYCGAVAWDELFAYWPGFTDAALIKAAKSTPEAEKFLAKYPWAEIVVDRSGKSAMDFRVDKLEGNDKPGLYLRLQVLVDPDTVAPAGRFLDLNGTVVRREILRRLDEETVFGSRLPYLNPAYGVYLEFPRRWRPRPGYGDVAGIPRSYGGDDGFFLVSAMNGEGWTPEEVARHEASHKLKPYGERPRLEKTAVNGREGYFVFPSPKLGTGAGACFVVRTRGP
ncbi:Dipeptidyl peptidase IV (DPP IV) N-terminal region [Desulfofundulus australicus DSM 11792]|uniref:Dipeptidyl peptidase IV (DPP IV) N-terminal region n=2 Tax=Desulfofundulus australicus TaxID=1566 RepID=A0A1M5DWW1_9FIRM|nr:Dipeptidyl peptidase IV (DPP IV) N-terminal region [Desulfofundulus australicus DSM 11792]